MIWEQKLYIAGIKHLSLYKILSKFTDNAERSGMVDMSEGQDAIQKDLVKLQHLVYGNVTRLKKASYSRDVIFPLHSIPMRPYLKSRVRFWSPQLRKNTDLLEQAQRRATKMIREMKNLS